MKRKMRSDFIAYKLVAAFAAAAVLQSLLMSLILMFGGVLRQSRMDAYQIFEERVCNRAENLENEMQNIWINFEQDRERIRQYFMNLNRIDAKDADKILEEIAPLVLDTMYHTKVTGTFLILPLEKEEDSYDALYFRNMEPDCQNKKTSDTYLLAGPLNIADRLNIRTDSNWRLRLHLEDENRDFYEKTLANLKLTGTHRLPGYWSPPFQMTPDGEEIITYSSPLADEKGNVLGVFGIELSVDSLYQFLQSDDFFTRDSYGYAIGIGDAGKGTIKRILPPHMTQKWMLGANQTIEWKEQEAENHIYKLTDQNNSQEMYGCMKEIALYHGSTPFPDEKWYLIGLIEKKEILKYSDILKEILTYSILLSLGTGGIIAIFISKWFTKNSRLIELAEVPVGMFEMGIKGHRVFMTSQIPFLLNLTGEQERTFRKNKNCFKAHLDQIYPQMGESGIAMIPINGEEHWIRITQKEKNGVINGIVEDITDEVLVTKALKVERDRDELTGVKNRRAFEELAKSCRLHPESDSNLGVVMCDLNELKLVNDVFGHEKGDEYIRFAAKALSKAFSGAQVFRIGGDEFALILRSTSEEEINFCGAMLDQEFSDYTISAEFKTCIAWGGALYDPERDIELKDILSRADAKMYQNKKEKKTSTECNNRRK